MGTLWPDLPALPRRVLCGHCRTHWVQPGRLIAGRYGIDCARKLGLIAAKRTRAMAQTGTNLLDLIEGERHDEPDDECDGHDRPADLERDGERAWDQPVHHRRSEDHRGVAARPGR